MATNAWTSRWNRKGRLEKIIALGEVGGGCANARATFVLFRFFLRPRRAFRPLPRVRDV